MTYLRFGIRDLLWAMVVLGLGLALGLEHRRAADFANSNRYLGEAIDNSGFGPSGNYVGPLLERKR